MGAEDLRCRYALLRALVRLEKDLWRPRGDANRWLVSDVFDLGAATSREAEVAREQAQRLALMEAPNLEEVRRVDEALQRYLPPLDPFFARWRHHMATHLGSIS